MEIDYSDGDDRTWRAAFREGYRRSPRNGELRNYKYRHWISRTVDFAAAGPWEAWPSKPIPSDAVFPPEPVVEVVHHIESAPALPETIGDSTVSSEETVPSGPEL